MIIEGILLVAKLLSGKGIIGSISGASAGTAANVIAKGTIFAKSGITGEIGSNAIGISTGEGVENSVVRLLKRIRQKNGMYLRKEPTGLQGWLKQRSERKRMYLKKEPTGLQGWFKKYSYC